MRGPAASKATRDRAVHRRTPRMDRQQAHRGTAQSTGAAAFSASDARIAGIFGNVEPASRRRRGPASFRGEQGRRWPPCAAGPWHGVERQTTRRVANLADAGRASPACAARGLTGDGRRSRFFTGFHPPAAFALGELLRAGYHQPQLLPDVPATRSRGLPHHPRADAPVTHEPFGALLAGGRAALRRLACARSRTRAGLAPRSALGFLGRKLGPDG